MGVVSARDVRHSDNLDDWQLIRKMWTGNDARSVLHRGPYEAKRAFESRKRGSAFKPYLRDLISRLTGELFSRAGEVSRETVVSDEFLSDIGPDGESYETQLINAASVLVAYNRAWILFDPSQGLRVVEPLHVTRSTPDAVVVKGKRAIGDDVFTDEEEVDAYTIYRPGSYEVYVESDEEGKDEERIDQGFYHEEGWEFSDGPPIFQVKLPWRVTFGLAVARAYRSLFRLESKYDAALTNALGGGLLQIATGGDDELKNNIEHALKNGAIAVPYDADSGEHKPLNIGTDGLNPGSEAVARRRQELFLTGYRSLQQASKRMSATEANLRDRGGPAAAMSILASTLQSLEELALPIIAEAEDSRRVDQDLSPSVDWPTDYAHSFDNSDEALVKEIFGALDIPVDAGTATDILVSRLESAGHSPDREAIREAVEEQRSREAQAESASGFSL